MIEAVNPYEIMLYKVVMGDKSDNIDKLRKGFGEAAFTKFKQSFVMPTSFNDNKTLLQQAEFISQKFVDFTKMKYEEVLGKVLFNLKMTWLNLSVYNEQNFLYENGKSLLENMLDDVLRNKDKYKYSKPFTLENIYGDIIK